MNNYRLQLKSDTGKFWLRVTAKDEITAKQMVCNAELCPESAILKIQDTQFYNKDGTLTYYSFLCGYIERVETETQWKELYMEHRTFHVRMGNKGERFKVWENFERDELTKARKLYNSIKIL